MNENAFGLQKPLSINFARDFKNHNRSQKERSYGQYIMYLTGERKNGNEKDFGTRPKATGPF